MKVKVIKKYILVVFIVMPSLTETGLQMPKTSQH